MAVYDFDPRLPKRAVPIVGKAELEEDASNLAIALKAVIADEERRRKFTNLIRDLVPFVQDVSVEHFADRSMLFKLRETFFGDEYLPASLISDGTINIAALILALYFQKKSLIVIEEPERSLHPGLLARLVRMMAELLKRFSIPVAMRRNRSLRYFVRKFVR